MKSKFSVASNVLLLTIVSSSIIITPWFSFDSINIPKITALYIGGSILLFLLIFQERKYIAKYFKLPSLLTILFILWALIAFILSETNLAEGLYGVDGRRTGLITYFFLCIVLLTSMTTSTNSFCQKLFVALISTGILSSAYALIQIAGSDPFLWNTQYKPIFGFYGNPNFLASLLGISGSALFPIIASKQFLGFKKFCAMTTILLYLYIIIETDS
jgi:hypothetical protein